MRERHAGLSTTMSTKYEKGSLRLISCLKVHIGNNLNRASNDLIVLIEAGASLY